jgi:L-threonylcarbamoyladenylate synthase
LYRSDEFPAMSNSQRIRILSGTEEDLRVLSLAIASGNPVAFPTETVYGLAANAFDPDACKRIFEVKGRPLIDPLIVHVTGPDHAAKLAEINPQAASLMARFWPGPLTIVLKKNPILPDIISAGLPTVALRCPRHPVARKLLFACGLPLVGPSANRFGYVSPTSVEHVVAGLGDRIDFVLDGGPCAIGLESTIVGMADPAHPVLFRPGAISREELSLALGVEVAQPKPHKDNAPADAPGMLKRHYSPKTPLTLFDDAAVSPVAQPNAANEAVVFFARPRGELPPWAAGKEIFSFSESGKSEEAARNVFSLLRALDEKKFARIYVQRAPNGGIGEAINDRLGRAAARV